ncbi:MAG TPA: hypothetical protein IAC63_03420 [Candidatus Enterousia avicola]|uniref:Uncharacterized protein n=1 Tax=Candidatus Enterousia avicola TaxID=2840787 RepID=A0A9D1SMI4_9PROT|nr:hypothetical protein [Candidatus Enterousia avicola]
MNEERQSFKRFMEGKTDKELSLENLMALVTSLEQRAKILRAFAIMQEVANLKRSIQKNANKKVIKSIQKKYEFYLDLISNMEQNKKEK